MATEPNEIIATAMSDTTGWAWKKCPRCEKWFTVEAAKCARCHGTGRVPVALEKPEYTLSLVEWAATQEWARMTCLSRPVLDNAGAIGLALNELARGLCSATEAFLRIRDLVAAAIQEHANGR